MSAAKLTYWIGYTLCINKTDLCARIDIKNKVASSVVAKNVSSLGCANIKDTQQSKTCIKEADWISHKDALILHIENGDENARGRRAAPQNKEG